MKDAPIGRLAPSPTGALHVGNVRTFLLAWLSARSRGGRVVLRIEDLEKPASGLVLEEMLSDLWWLGFDWGEGPVWNAETEAELESARRFARQRQEMVQKPLEHKFAIRGTHGPYVQSLRSICYQSIFESLRSRNLIYPCVCARADYAASAPHEGDVEPCYPGTCRERFESEAEARDWLATEIETANRAGTTLPRLSEPVWRFRVPEGDVEFEDEVFGGQEISIAKTVGDFVVFRTPKQPAYQLAVVADDIAMGITQVVRGADLLASTARQILLYRALGAELPSEWVHVPLILGPDGKRIAKRHGDSRIRSLRDQGVSAAHIVGTLAVWTGISTKQSALPADLLAEFSRIPTQRDALILDPQKLAMLENKV